MSDRGAMGLTTILGIVALVLTAGFLFWLYDRSTSYEPVTPVMEDTMAEQTGALGVADLRADPAAVAGERGAVDSVEVAGRLGRAVFTFRLDTATAYPVLLSPDLIQRGSQVYGGDLISVRGRFYQLTDSLKNVWVERGAVDQGQVGNLPATATFLLADSLRIF